MDGSTASPCEMQRTGFVACFRWATVGAYPSRTVQHRPVSVRRSASLQRLLRPFHRKTHSRECACTATRYKFLVLNEPSHMGKMRLQKRPPGVSATRSEWSALNPLQTMCRGPTMATGLAFLAMVMKAAASCDQDELWSFSSYEKSFAFSALG